MSDQPVPARRHDPDMANLVYRGGQGRPDFKAVESGSFKVGIDIAKSLGRSQWSVLLRDGRVVSEWNGVEWYDVPKGKVSVRLYAPIGRYGELGDAFGRATLDGFAWQLKKATTIIGGLGGAVDAHLIGCVDQSDGGCRIIAYEYAERSLIDFRDNAHNVAYRQIGPISALHLGIREEFTGG